jgi:hypothetical protein
MEIFFTILLFFGVFFSIHWHSFLCFLCLILLFHCILEYPTSRLEMGVVADLFDHKGDSHVNYKDFLSSLRPETSKNRHTPVGTPGGRSGGRATPGTLESRLYQATVNAHNAPPRPNDGEYIHEEMRSQVEQCTCRQPYKIIKIRDGTYSVCEDFLEMID